MPPRPQQKWRCLSLFAPSGLSADGTATTRPDGSQPIPPPPAYPPPARACHTRGSRASGTRAAAVSRDAPRLPDGCSEKLSRPSAHGGKVVVRALPSRPDHHRSNYPATAPYTPSKLKCNRTAWDDGQRISDAPQQPVSWPRSFFWCSSLSSSTQQSQHSAAYSAVQSNPTFSVGVFAAAKCPLTLASRPLLLAAKAAPTFPRSAVTRRAPTCATYVS
jgi:hypothetical protein